MSEFRNRATTLLVLLFFFVAGLARTAPAICCCNEVERPEATEATTPCCPAPPQQAPSCPGQHPCDSQQDCPKQCCAFTGEDVLTPPAVKPAHEDSTLNAPTFVHAVGLGHHDLLVTRTGNTDPPVFPTKTSLHLRIQVLLI